MRIDKVTITGADDSTDIEWMVAMQDRFPFVEWGVLVSKSQAGNYRFPSVDWLKRLVQYQSKLKTSVHVCGKWVRQICGGQWEDMLLAVGSAAEHAQRIQLNFHAQAHSLDEDFFAGARNALEKSNWQLIFQIDGVNDLLLLKARRNELNAVPLYDLSGGAGILPSEWPRQTDGVYTGYAGGLGPQNVLEQIEKIKTVANGQIWIDMETRVRTDDDSRLDEALVESVLEQCSVVDCLHIESL